MPRKESSSFNVSQLEIYIHKKLLKQFKESIDSK